MSNAIHVGTEIFSYTFTTVDKRFKVKFTSSGDGIIKYNFEAYSEDIDSSWNGDWLLETIINTLIEYYLCADVDYTFGGGKGGGGRSSGGGSGRH